jgi:hypothetical protein
MEDPKKLPLPTALDIPSESRLPEKHYWKLSDDEINKMVINSLIRQGMTPEQAQKAFNEYL